MAIYNTNLFDNAVTTFQKEKMKFSDWDVLSVMEKKNTVEISRIKFLIREIRDWENHVPIRLHRFVRYIIEGNNIHGIVRLHGYDIQSASTVLLKLQCYLEMEYIDRYGEHGKWALSKVKNEDKVLKLDFYIQDADYEENYAAEEYLEESLEEASEELINDYTSSFIKTDLSGKKNILDFIDKKRKKTINTKEEPYKEEIITLKTYINFIENFESIYEDILGNDIQQQICLLLMWDHDPKSIYESLKINKEQFYNLSFKRNNNSILDKIAKSF